MRQSRGDITILQEVLKRTANRSDDSNNISIIFRKAISADNYLKNYDQSSKLQEETKHEALS